MAGFGPSPLSRCELGRPWLESVINVCSVLVDRPCLVEHDVVMYGNRTKGRAPTTTTRRQRVVSVGHPDGFETADRASAGWRLSIVPPDSGGRCLASGGHERDPAVLADRVGAGALYALVALGLVLVYRSSVINFAHGAIGASLTFVDWELTVKHGVSAAVAIPVCLVLAAVVGIVSYLIVIRPLRSASGLVRIIATLGLLAVFQTAIRFATGRTVRQSGRSCRTGASRLAQSTSARTGSPSS